MATADCQICDLKNSPTTLSERMKPIAGDYFAELNRIAEHRGQGTVNFFNDLYFISYFEEAKKLCEQLKMEFLSASWRHNAHFYSDADLFAFQMQRNINAVDNGINVDKFFYIGYSEYAWLDYLCVTGSKSTKFEHGYKHLHRIEFHVTKQTSDVNEAELVKKYGSHSHVINMISSSKSLGGYVYCVVFAKRHGCAKSIQEIEELIFDAKPNSLKTTSHLPEAEKVGGGLK